MTRGDLQKLARLRLQEARVLLRAKCFCGAYYLAGYAVECALKACIARETRRYEFPDREKVNQSYKHDLNVLLGIAGLRGNYDQEVSSHPGFEVNWATVKDWDETSRYDPMIDKRKAQELYKAITNRSNGVLPWLRKHW